MTRHWRVRGKLLAICVSAAAAAALVSGCASSGTFPSVLADPAPRSDATLSPAQVKEATETLISEGDRLCSQANPGKSAAASNCSAAKIVTTSSTAAAGSGVKP